MGCLLFGQRRRKEAARNRIDDSSIAGSSSHMSEHKKNLSPLREENLAQGFSFRELMTATKNFRQSNLLGRGGFGRVYKGHLQSGEVVAIKQLMRGGAQGSKEFLTEVLMLIMVRHPNLVTLYGFCNEGNEKLLVYEYMAEGSLEDHLFGLNPQKKPLDWNTRVKIALGAAKGLQYLHDVVTPAIIHRDMKAANILLDDDFNPKLSDFGLAKFGPVGENTHVSTRVMGTQGYCAPEYARTGHLTTKSDVYSFGVVLLELITGRRALDSSKPGPEKDLLHWARRFRLEKRTMYHMADPALEGCFPRRAYYQFVMVANLCLQDNERIRPIIGDVVTSLMHVASQPYVLKPEQRAANVSSTPSPSSSSSSSMQASGGFRFRKLRKYFHNKNNIMER